MNRPVSLPIKGITEQIVNLTSAPMFGIPGGGASLELIDELERHNFPFFRTHFEGAAALMAGTVGRLSNKPGVCLSIKGPGLANMVPGLACNNLEGFPIIAFCESYEKNIDWSKQHKGMDHENLVSAVSKGCFGISDAQIIANACNLAQSGIPGPVVLNLAAGSGPSIPGNVKQTVDPDVNRLVAKSKKPIVIVGTLAVWSEWVHRLETLNIPVFTTASAKGVINETLPNAAGVYTGVGQKYTPEFTILQKADLVVGLGLRAREVLAAQPFQCPSVNIDHIESDQGFEFSSSSVLENFNVILDALCEHSWGLELIENAVKKLDQKLLCNRFLPAHVYLTVQKYFKGNIRGVFDTGYFCTVAEHIWRAKRPDLCLMSGQSRYMGTGLPMAIAAAFYDKSIPTVAVLGDGGIAMYLAEAKTAADLQLPLLILLISDGGFGSIRNRALRDGLTSAPLLINNSSWLAAFDGLGVPGKMVSSEIELISALESWSPNSGPLFIQSVFEPEQYQKMVAGIRS